MCSANDETNEVEVRSWAGDNVAAKMYPLCLEHKMTVSDCGEVRLLPPAPARFRVLVCTCLPLRCVRVCMRVYAVFSDVCVYLCLCVCVCVCVRACV
jgi:hypothetical protein